MPKPKQIKELTAEEFKIEKGSIIGEGNTGIIFKAIFDKKDVAIKQINKDTSHGAKSSSHRFLDECDMLCELTEKNAPNIITLLAFHTNLSHHYLILEYAEKGNLFDLLKNDKTLNLSTRLQIMLDILKALSFMHKHKLVHRDVKSSNVLITGELRAKLSDFEYAEKEKYCTQMTTPGTELWMAPEIFFNIGNYTTAADVYSATVILLELITYQSPLSAIESKDQIKDYIKNRSKDYIPANSCSENIACLIVKGWKSPKERPTAQEMHEELEKEQKAGLGL